MWEQGQCISVATALDSCCRAISCNNYLENLSRITLPISEILNLPRLPPSSKANTRKSTSSGNGSSSSLPAGRPISSSLGQQHGALPTSCIKQQVPGVEVTAQYTLLVKSLQGQEDLCCPQLHLLFLHSPCFPAVPMGSQSPALS